MWLFIAYTLIWWLGTACFTKILHISIQPGQWIDTLFKWQDKLYNWDIQGRTFRYKVLGGCEICFSHFISFLSYWAYVVFMVHYDLWVLDWWFSCVLWYLLYISIASMMGLFFIVKLFSIKQ